MAEPKGWKEHPRGGTQVFPVTGWQTGVAMGGKAGAVRIEYALDPTFEKRDSRQLLLHPAQLRSLAETLSELADRLEARAAEGPDGSIN